MPRGLVIVLALLLAGAGCRCSRTACMPCPVQPACAYEPCDAVAPPDLAGLSPAELDAVVACRFPCTLPGISDDYRRIAPHEAQCAACQGARVAQMVDLEEHWANVQIDCERGAVERALCLTRELLKLQEADLRNQAAGSALTALYALAGVEAQRAYVLRGVAEAELAVERLDKLKARGLDREGLPERSALAIQASELHDRGLQLDLARVELNGQLKRLVGCELNGDTLFMPDVDWRVEVSPPDVDAAVARGLACRSDVRSVRLAVCRLEKTTVPVARAVLGVADASLGRVVPQPGLIHQLRCACCNEHEEAVRCRQLRLLLRESEELATAKIKAAAYKVAVQQRRVLLAREGVVERRTELRRLETLRDVNETTAFEVGVARGRVLDAEAALSRLVAELKVAEVTLAQEQGLLVEECGYGAHIQNEGCCPSCCRCDPCGGPATL